MNKKYYWLMVGIVLIGIGTGLYFLVKKPIASMTTTNIAQQQGQPARAAELKGFVKSIEGNELIIINELSDDDELTDAQKVARKAERASLSTEERQALKAEESSVLQKEDITITIPVGIEIKKTTGDATGELVDGGLIEIKEGTYVSIWVDHYKATDQAVEFVKIRGTI